MTERPIIMSAPMVRAILAGKKTQTRRVLRDQAPIDLGASANGTHLNRRPVHDHGKLVGHRMAPVLCPYGQSGDRLWVRETFAKHPTAYRADFTDQRDIDVVRWTPAIHMPRSACRLVLDVMDVEVERLQDITSDDCVAEGIEPHDSGDAIEEATFNRAAYEELWDSLNAKRGYSWASNPWVWVVSFLKAS